ncbi:hypothetical protein L21TH_0482 [Caldisalinibacter kiritimatiensis]|uniref:Uncharacterized protein n=1 Tax=Caldisalinibacter kiritimatiensis TaxID=1304284 RepID=R1CGL2_9FIRM|nr:hypothetical protein L21TH_0482 [Caldisalinibacter kiritimatiensis]
MKQTTNDLNTWRGSYIVPLETPDATYEIVATAERTGRIETDNLQLTIKGNMFELVKPRIRNSN